MDLELFKKSVSEQVPQAKSVGEQIQEQEQVLHNALAEIARIDNGEISLTE